uniref:Sushi domain containing 2 n=1 Tax=Xiphophorus couchianus TaxID=32473 RepID=A0A3B5LRS1_9TELE
VNSTLWQNYGTPNMAGQLRMTWNSSLIKSERVNVELWGYREVSRSPAGSSSLQAEISYLYSLGRNISNTGDFSFIPQPRERFSTWELGNIRITASPKSEGERNVQSLWSGGHVLAWHLEQSFRDDSSAWAQRKCLQWDDLERKLPDFLDELIDCPCSLAQARADTGRFHVSPHTTMYGRGCIRKLFLLRILSKISEISPPRNSYFVLGVFVFVPSPQNVTVIFSSGAAVELRLYDATMTATVLLLVEFSNLTLGLLGRMNSDPSDDLMTRSGEVISSNATLEEIFTFGAEWNISNMSSLFTYDSHYLLDSYFFPLSHDPAFVPAFSLPLKPDDPLAADMLSMCLGEGAQFCIHDTLISRSLAVGNATLRAHQHHQALMEALKPVVSCGWLPAPRNGKKNGTHYLQGKTLGFTCNEGYILYRSTERTCLKEGTWTGEQPYCITAYLFYVFLSLL